MKRSLVGGLMLVATGLVHADVLGLRAGVTAWGPDFSGTVQSGPEQVDLEQELGFSEDTYAHAYVSFEHPVPLLPALRLQFTELDHVADGTLNKEFDGISFTGTTRSELDLSHADLVLYWQPLDNVVSLDLGLQVKKLDGELKVSGTTGSGTEESFTEIDEFVPMLYGAIGADLPLTGLGFSTSVAGLRFEDNQLLEVDAKLRYDIRLVGFEIGWRELRLELDDVSDVIADIAIGGPYAGVSLHF